jgi:hypothetical protein
MPGIATDFLFTIALEVPVLALGETPYGARRIARVAGGSFDGPRLRGTVLPGGGGSAVTYPTRKCGEFLVRRCRLLHFRTITGMRAQARRQKKAPRLFRGGARRESWASHREGIRGPVLKWKSGKPWKGCGRLPGESAFT